MEAMVAGAILATSIGITFSLIAQAQAGQKYAFHRQRAVDIARTKIEELATLPSCAASGPTAFTNTVYTGTFTTGNAGGVSAPVIPAGVLCAATVSVNYPAAVNSAEDLTDAAQGNGKGRVTFTRQWAPNL